MIELFVAVFVNVAPSSWDLEQGVLQGTGAKIHFFSSEVDIAPFLDQIDVLVVSLPQVDRKMIEKMKRCRGIITRNIGFDNIDIQAASDQGIVVCNVPDYCQSEVSDHVMGLILSLTRRIHLYDCDVKAGKWQINSPQGLPLAGRLQNMTCGLLGFGGIAREVAKKAAPFFARLIATDTKVDQAIASSYQVNLVDLKSLFEQADVISLHIPLFPATYHLVNQELLNLMKSSAYLINTSRGGIIDEMDLYETLKSRNIAGAALDVTEVEPLPPDHPFRLLDNIIVTPHVAFYSKESSLEQRRKAMEEAKRFLLGEKPLHPLN